ncbi:MAG: DUF5668 domain-containing protein [Acidobacteriota bacterium]
MAEQRTYLSTRSIVGLAIVAFGVLLTLDNLGLVEVDNYWRFWPVLFLLAGLSRLGAGEIGKGVFWLILGTVFLLPNVIDFDWDTVWDLLRDYWPLVLIAFGLRMVVGSFTGRGRQREPSPIEVSDGSAASSAEIDAFAFLSSVTRRVEAQDFRHADLTAVLGGCELDLTRAEVAPEGATVEIFAFWGGVELRIPEHWAVEPQVAVMMGGVEDKTRQTAAQGRLVIKGFTLMGGLEIRN